MHFALPSLDQAKQLCTHIVRYLYSAVHCSQYLATAWPQWRFCWLFTIPSLSSQPVGQPVACLTHVKRWPPPPKHCICKKVLCLDISKWISHSMWNPSPHNTGGKYSLGIRVKGLHLYEEDCRAIKSTYLLAET